MRIPDADVQTCPEELRSKSKCILQPYVVQFVLAPSRPSAAPKLNQVHTAMFGYDFDIRYVLVLLMGYRGRRPLATLSGQQQQQQQQQQQ